MFSEKYTRRFREFTCELPAAILHLLPVQMLVFQEKPGDKMLNMHYFVSVVRQMNTSNMMLAPGSVTPRRLQFDFYEPKT